ncbi:UNVERIFIED_CONTAM: hypothetical protein RMT77_003763 [Armadillidium vulgare]
MNTNMESAVKAGRGRGNLSDSLENEMVGNLNCLRRPYKHPPEVQVVKSRCKAESKLSAEAPEFIPRLSESCGSLQSNNEEGCNSVPDDVIPQYKYATHPLILCVSDLVVKLSYKPHRFSQIATKMASLFTKLVRKDIMKEVIAVIIEQGIGEPNFRFIGGRLCQHLSKNVTQLFEGTSFRQLLLMRCQEEYSHKDYYLQFEVSRLCGFTLFLSDIYSNVLTKEGHRIEVLRKGLITLLLLLMTYPSDDTLKCVGQVLKGSGRLLDRDDDKSFSDLMDALKDITLTSKVPDNIVSLLLSVIEYRASDWGQIKVSNSLSSSNSKLDNTAPVYNKNVSEYEVEENYSSSDSDDDECYELNFEADEMDDEIAEAFEEFINLHQ